MREFFGFFQHPVNVLKRGVLQLPPHPSPPQGEGENNVHYFSATHPLPHPALDLEVKLVVAHRLVGALDVVVDVQVADTAGGVVFDLTDDVGTGAVGTDRIAQLCGRTDLDVFAIGGAGS